MGKTGLCAICFLLLVVSCSNIEKAGDITNRLPQNELSKYSDSFDKMRNDLWEESQFTFNKAQMANFKRANMTFGNGELLIRTKTGCFSKSGLLTKYVFSGDFDIQIDCHINFLEGKLDMDHRVYFAVIEKDKELRDSDMLVAEILKKIGDRKARLRSFCRTDGGFTQGKSIKLDDFHGTIRFIRKGRKSAVFCRTNNSTKWKDQGEFYFTPKDLKFGFALQNFDRMRTSIKAEHQISTVFENFKVNAAEKIVEEEI